MWENFKEIQNRFDNDYDITIYITSLAFHPQAFTAQCGASLIEKMKGRDVMFKYVDACYENQDMYMNASIGDAKMSEIDEVFAKIAEKAGVFDESFTKEKFLQDLHNWEMAVNPAYTEHKIALGYGVFGESKKSKNIQLISFFLITCLFCFSHPFVHSFIVSFSQIGAPKSVIDDKLVKGTESAWGPDEWAEKLKSLQ